MQPMTTMGLTENPTTINNMKYTNLWIWTINVREDTIIDISSANHGQYIDANRSINHNKKWQV